MNSKLKLLMAVFLILIISLTSTAADLFEDKNRYYDMDAAEIIVINKDASALIDAIVEHMDSQGRTGALAVYLLVKKEDAKWVCYQQKHVAAYEGFVFEDNHTFSGETFYCHKKSKGAVNIF